MYKLMGRNFRPTNLLNWATQYGLRINVAVDVLNGHLKIDKTKILMTNGSLINEGRKYCRMLPMDHSAMLSKLLTCVKR